MDTSLNISIYPNSLLYIHFDDRSTSPSQLAPSTFMLFIFADSLSLIKVIYMNTRTLSVTEENLSFPQQLFIVHRILGKVRLCEAIPTSIAMTRY